MTFFTRKSLTFTLLLAACGLAPHPVSAQYRPNPNPPGYLPPGQTIASTQANAPRSGYTYAPPAPVYPAYPEYKGVYGGYLSGGADVVNAQGNFLVQKQQAALSAEQVKQAKIQTQRQNIDEWLYERNVMPTLEDDRERFQAEQYRRSRNNPPLTEIWSGKTLNDLMLVLEKALGVPGPRVPLDPAMLRHINVTSGTGGNVGMGLLKDAGQLQWPSALQDPAYAVERKKLDQLTLDAVKAGQAGPVPASLTNDINKLIDTLTNRLKGNISQTDVNDYMIAKRYLGELANSIKVLQQPNAAKYVTGQMSAKGDTVSELVYNMTKQGLQFAPATRGDEEAYTSLHRAMVFYDDVVHQSVARQAPK